MILDGKKVRDDILTSLKDKIDKNKYDITFAIVLIGNNDASNVYVKNKIKYAEKIGIKVKLIHKEESSEEEIINIINDLNNDPKISGIILQSPTPDNINFENCIKYISQDKDIDGLTKDNFYKLVNNEKCLHPCTSKGIIRLLKYYNIDLVGKDVCIIGRGKLVGKPLIFELLNENATVTVCHTKTKNLKAKTLNADIIILGAGKMHLLKENMIKENVIVVDAGVTIKEGKTYGDADFDNIKDKCLYITPCIGGVGPMTIAMLLENVIEAYEMENKNG